MKFSSKFLFVSILGTAVFVCAVAYAGVCFITGDCGQNIVVSRCGADFNGYTKESCAEGYKLGGNSCSYNGKTKYERCECDASYFKWVLPGDSKYNYEDRAEKNTSSDDKYCEETRAHAKYCKPEFAYAEESDIATSWTMLQIKPSVCDEGKELDPDSETCEETDGIKVGGHTYKKYKACRCPSLAGGKKWQSCDKPHQKGKGTVCDGKYSECGCDVGYLPQSDGTCVENKQDDGSGTKGGFVGQCSNPYGIRYSNNDLVATSCNNEADVEWKLYYENGSRNAEISGLACRFMEKNPSVGLDIIYLDSADLEERINNIVVSGEDFDEIYEVNLHPLFSSLLAKGQADWGFDLGVAERPVAYKDGKEYSHSGYNFPLLMYGVLHTGGAYEMYCGENSKKTDNPKEYGYYGWLGNIQGWIDAMKAPVFGGGSPDVNVVKAVKALKFRPYTYSKSCHPKEFPPYEDYKCENDECSILKDKSEEVIQSFGGDKCLNFVFGLNASELEMPALVVDVKNRIAYRVDSEPRFKIEYDNLSWDAEIVHDHDGKIRYTDYAGNFLPWAVDESKAYGSDGVCEKLCYDREAEYNNIEGGDINTYPYMNKFWMEKVASGEVSMEEGLKVLSENRDKDTGHRILNTFIGGHDYGEAKYGNKEDSDDWLWRKYFNDNMGNTLNGVFGISNPWGIIRDEGTGPDKEY